MDCCRTFRPVWLVLIEDGGLELSEGIVNLGYGVQ